MLNIEEDILVVGLGNIGREYEHTRHNIGFDVIDDITSILELDFRNGFDGNYAKTKLNNGTNIYFLKPSTFMNLSGISVKKLCDYFKIDYQNIIVIQDDMDMDIGNVKAKYSAGDGGHRGIRSIGQELNTQNFLRIKVGIGHPRFKSDVVNFVLTKPSDIEIETYNKGIEDAARLTMYIMSLGYDKGSNKFYSLKKKEMKEQEAVKEN